MHRKFLRLLARAGALALSVAMAATPALAEMGSVAMIGGADGPTTIFVAGSMQYLLILVCAVVLIAACVGIWRTRRK